MIHLKAKNGETRGENQNVLFSLYQSLMCEVTAKHCEGKRVFSGEVYVCFRISNPRVNKKGRFGARGNCKEILVVVRGGGESEMLC